MPRDWKPHDGLSSRGSCPNSNTRPALQLNVGSLNGRTAVAASEQRNDCKGQQTAALTAHLGAQRELRVRPGHERQLRAWRGRHRQLGPGLERLRRERAGLGLHCLLLLQHTTQLSQPASGTRMASLLPNINWRLWSHVHSHLLQLFCRSSGRPREELPLPVCYHRTIVPVPQSPRVGTAFATVFLDFKRVVFCVVL